LATASDADRPVLQAQLDTLNTKKSALTSLGKEPKPERTYDALTLTAAGPQLVVPGFVHVLAADR
jgi:hypothetical protein